MCMVSDPCFWQFVKEYILFFIIGFPRLDNDFQIFYGRKVE